MRTIFVKILFALFVIFLFLNCEQKTKKNIFLDEVNKRIGTKLFLPRDADIYNFDQDTAVYRHEVFVSKVKIVSYINGNCSACISDLLKWNKFITENFPTQKIIFLFYVYSDDFLKFQHINETYIHFPFPLFFDTNNYFFKKNQLLEDQKMFQTFLVGEDGKVILVGNPLSGLELKALYLYEIKKRLKLY